MIRVAFLACAATLPGAEGRRRDAFEHDLEVAALRPAFAARGMELVEIDWRAPIEAFDGIRLVLVGTTWDYQDHRDEFIARLDALEQGGAIVCNPATLVRWNADKRYLAQLGENGATIVPTIWCDEVTPRDVADALDRFDTDRVVIKRRVGAGAEGQFSFARDALPDTGWAMGRPAMIQPFLPAIVDEGEYTFVFVDGAFSHGVHKRAAEGDYRVQSIYGGFEAAFAPTDADLAAARAVVAALPFEAPLYCRVDMARLPSGELAVMEAEMIEPYLYPQQGPELGERMAAALERRLGSAAFQVAPRICAGGAPPDALRSG